MMTPRLLLLPALVGLVLLPTGCGDDAAPAPTAPLASADFAPPAAPVIYLHYDYMVQDTADEFSPAHSDAPHQSTIDTLVDRFRRHGIQVVIDPHHTALPHERETDICGDPEIEQFRTRYFHPLNNRPWHYAVFAHDIAICGTRGTPGLGELPGFTFFVALGASFQERNSPWRQCAQDFGAYEGRCVRMEAGLFLHELGHNLELQHGGNQGDNWKPNYVSVMNYLFQNGIPYAATPGSTVIAGYRIDYSEFALPTLDEHHLDERVGLGGPATDADISSHTLYSCADPADPVNTCGFGGVEAVPAAARPIDWDQDAAIEPDVASDVNYSEVALAFAVTQNGAPELGLETGFDDWAHVQAFLRTPAYVTHTLKPKRVTP